MTGQEEPRGSKVHGFGIVGCGVIAPIHARAIAALPNARLVTVTDIVSERARSFAATYGVECDASLSELLARPDVDVVSVCVPSGLHADIGVRAAEAGKHLLVEKPIDISLPAADRLIDAARNRGVTLSVVSQHRFDPGLVELHDLLERGALGRLVLGAASIKWYRTQAYYDAGAWRGTLALDGGGALMNQGVHYTDLLRWSMGAVEEVTALCATQNHAIEVEDVALAMLRFRSGAIGMLEASTSVFPGLPERLEVSGTGGSVIIEDGAIVLRAFVGENADMASSSVANAKPAEKSGAAADPGALPIGAHMAQIADLLDSIDEHRSPIVSGEEARNALEVVCAVYESARRHTSVSLPLRSA